MFRFRSLPSKIIGKALPFLHNFLKNSNYISIYGNCLSTFDFGFFKHVKSALYLLGSERLPILSKMKM